MRLALLVLVGFVGSSYGRIPCAHHAANGVGNLPYSASSPQGTVQSDLQTLAVPLSGINRAVVQGLNNLLYHWEQNKLIKSKPLVSYRDLSIQLIAQRDDLLYLHARASVFEESGRIPTLATGKPMPEVSALVWVRAPQDQEPQPVAAIDAQDNSIDYSGAGLDISPQTGIFFGEGEIILSTAFSRIKFDRPDQERLRKTILTAFKDQYDEKPKNREFLAEFWAGEKSEAALVKIRKSDEGEVLYTLRGTRFLYQHGRRPMFVWTGEGRNPWHVIVRTVSVEVDVDCSGEIVGNPRVVNVEFSDYHPHYSRRDRFFSFLHHGSFPQIP